MATSGSEQRAGKSQDTQTDEESGSGSESKAEEAPKQGFAFRPSKLSAFGEKIGQIWKNEEKPTQNRDVEALEKVLLPPPKKRRTDEEYNDQEEAESSENHTETAPSDGAAKSVGNRFLFGSKIRDRVVATVGFCTMICLL